jgi:hypothetical protein
MNVVRLSALRTDRSYPGLPLRKYSWYSYPYMLGAESNKMIKSMKNSSDCSGNRTKDIPSRSAVPQLTVPKYPPFINIDFTRIFVFYQQTIQSVTKLIFCFYIILMFVVYMLGTYSLLVRFLYWLWLHEGCYILICWWNLLIPQTVLIVLHLHVTYYRSLVVSSKERKIEALQAQD